MKTAIFGAGALGGYFGGRLLQAGYDVSFIARGSHLQGLQQSGLSIESPLGDATLMPIVATDKPDAIGPVDVVMFLVKLYDTEAAANALKPLLADNTIVVSFQNGVDGWQRIGDIVGHERVLGGIAYIFADVKSPGVIRHSGGPARLLFGEFAGSSCTGAVALGDAFTKASINHEQVDNIDVLIWEKFVLLTAISGITALTRLPIGAVLANDMSRSLFHDALNEAAAVGFASCKKLDPAIANRQFEFAASLPYGMRASMLDDLERGKRLELEYLSGQVVSLGKKHGIMTPVHDAVLRALHPFANGDVMS